MRFDYNEWPCLVKFAAAFLTFSFMMAAPIYIYTSVTVMGDIGRMLGAWAYGPY